MFEGVCGNLHLVDVVRPDVPVGAYTTMAQLCRREHKRSMLDASCPRLSKRLRLDTIVPVFHIPPLYIDKLLLEPGPKRTKLDPVVFTLTQVQQIVTLRDQQVRDEYERTLQCMLQEQVASFSRFYQDCISRFLSSSTHAESYIS